MNSYQLGKNEIFTIEQLYNKIRYSPITVKNIKTPYGLYIKTVYLFGVIPIYSFINVEDNITKCWEKLSLEDDELLCNTHEYLINEKFKKEELSNSK